MTPELYLYRESEKGFEFYVSEFSTVSGLLLFEKKSHISVVRFGATLYKQYGWATEKEIPVLNTVGEVVEFLLSEESIGLVDFSAELSGYGELSTHDDGECHFVLNSKEQCLNIMKSTIVPSIRGLLINKLLENQGSYFSCSSAENGGWRQ